MTGSGVGSTRVAGSVLDCSHVTSIALARSPPNFAAIERARTKVKTLRALAEGRGNRLSKVLIKV